MSEPIVNLAQGYFPRHRDFVASLREECAGLGISPKEALVNYEDYGVHNFLVAPNYQNSVRKVIKERDTWRCFYPQTMSRTPYAYAFIINPEKVVEIMQEWHNFGQEVQPHQVGAKRNAYGIHYALWKNIINDGSMPYAAHLDIAAAMGAVDGRELGAVVPTEFYDYGVTIPLASYVAHLRLDASQLVDLASIYYRWGRDVVVYPKDIDKSSIRVGLLFNRATSHDGYPKVMSFWEGFVPEGTELAWELASAKWLRHLDRKEWRDYSNRVVSSGSSVNRFDEVASKRLPLDQVTMVVENDIDDNIFESMRGNDNE